MNRPAVALAAVMLVAWSVSPPQRSCRADAPAALARFENRVRPLLVARCVKCHGPEKAESGLRLDQVQAVRRGGDSGAAIVAGKPDESLLIQAVRYDGDVRMPPDKPLSAEQVRDLEQWVRDGAVWPAERDGAATDTVIERAKASLQTEFRKAGDFARAESGTRKGEVPEKGQRFGTAASALQLWLTAESLVLADGEQVVTWADSSGHQRHAAPTSGLPNGTGQAPTFVARGDVDGGPAVRFGSKDGLATPGDKPLPMTGDAGYSMFVRATLRQRFGGYPYDGLLGFGEPASPANPGRPRSGLLQVDRTAGGWKLAHAGGWNHDALLPRDSMTFWFDQPVSLVVVKSPGPMRTSTTFFVNGSPVSQPLTGSDVTPDLIPRSDMGAFLGHVMPWWNGFVGDISEVALFDRPLTGEEVASFQKARHGRALSDSARATADPLWAFRPVSAVEPSRKDPVAWPVTGVDHFILDKLHNTGLEPAPRADRRTLIRRACFDLLGLPPGPEQVEAFANDPGEDREVFGRLVEQLLASPQYGERWARHWLDVARYADSGGYETDIYFRNAWRYRDYVVRSFNDDKPYDLFVQEQLAGDELWPGDLDLQGTLSLPESERRKLEARIGTGLFALGPQIHESNMDARLIAYERLTDWVDTAGAAFLGLTIGCSRCHDHKFDPISQRDYFALQAVFAPSGEFDEPITTPMERTDFKQHYPRIIAVDEARRAVRLFEQSLAGRTPSTEERTRLADLRNALAQAVLDMPAGATSAPGTPWDGIMEVPTATTLARLRPGLIPEVRLLNRGELDRPRDLVPPALPEVLALLTGSERELPGPDGSRAALARWITRPDHPLTARVMVNRIWRGHFGEGLVRTPNDFGRMGTPPTHPELLDWLAAQFVRRGWSIKEMHRLILNSATWQMSSLMSTVPDTPDTPDTPGAPASRSAVEIDPENKLLSRMHRRRLESETLWDFLHAASGSLNLKAGGRPVMPALEPDELAALRDKYHWVVTADPTEHTRRALYLMQRRNFRIPIFEVFDSPTNAASVGRRDSTTVAPQALWTLNNRRVYRQAELLAERVAREAGADPLAQIDRAWLITIGRRPTADERAESRDLLTSLASGDSPATALTAFCLTLFNLGEFLYVD